MENLEPTLSINHNWTNGFGLRAMWAFLASELAAVQAALADCRESFAPGGWEAQCERVLRCNAAMCVNPHPHPHPNPKPKPKPKPKPNPSLQREGVSELVVLHPAQRVAQALGDIEHAHLG